MQTHRIILYVALLILVASCATTSYYPYHQTHSEGYTVQLGAFKSVNNASRFVDNLNKQGLDAFLFLENGYYKVRFGSYQSYAEAKRQAETVKINYGLTDYYIVRPEQLTAYKSRSVTNSTSYIRNELVKSAEQYIGVPYVWGGSTSAGFDCSGLTRAVYRLNGIDIPRVSRDQYKNGTAVKKTQLLAGDLVFFATQGGRTVSHVGIYVGDGLFIHSPKKGDTVRRERLNNSYWSKVYVGAKSYI